VVSCNRKHKKLEIHKAFASKKNAKNLLALFLLLCKSRYGTRVRNWKKSTNRLISIKSTLMAFSPDVQDNYSINEAIDYLIRILLLLY
jgi:hypothetical protein